ncbi:hypothetical protein [Longimicrobium sp.]|uniref:hypothetical protein n=1 Tax=Longimicrobium sp. TaxID=2029185 RepID=UPI003B3A9649
MKKLMLDPDLLLVASFPTTMRAADLRGTVRGHDDTIESEWCTQYRTCSQPPCDTLRETCATC